MHFRFHSDISPTPFLDEAKAYSLRLFRKDLFAAFAVCLLTIPQSIAYSLLAGFPPIAGLFSAIFGTILTAGFGSSRHLVSGPSTGTAILIQTSTSEILHSTYPQLSLIEQQVMSLNILMHIVLIAGLIQIAVGLFKMGKALQFVSRSVILGYFAGVAFAILIHQLYYLFGISFLKKDYAIYYQLVYLVSHIRQINWASTILGLSGIAFLLLIRKRFKYVPDALLMIVLISVIAFVLNYNRFAKIPHFEKMGSLSSFIPRLKFPFVELEMINLVFPAAFAISLLAILEIFSVSRGIAVRTGQQLNTNQDLLGAGIANLALSFIHGAMPASGSISRSILNFQSKATTRFAAIFSGIFVFILMIFFWPLVSYIPLTALAAFLIATVPAMMDFEKIQLCFKATKGDATVFILTFASCIIFSLNVAFFIGIILSIGFYLKRSSEPHLVEYAFTTKGRLKIVSTKERMKRKIRVIGVTGELYFGMVDLFQSTLQKVAEDPHVEVIVLRLSSVFHMDASVCLAILRLHEYLHSTKRHLVISGLTKEVMKVLYDSGLVEKIGSENFFFTDETNPQLSTWKACLRAQELIRD